jgi:hypothetical protein
MSRILRFAVLGLVLALPLGIPQVSQAASRACGVHARAGYTYSPYRHWHGHYHHHFRR